ncbi:MAG: hypothetical protein JWN04_3559 [Myxococcaceae bacterium]|nr:hypothetical protein [Myxococcaceae bacterium]
MTKRQRSRRIIRDDVVYTNPLTFPLFALLTLLTGALLAGMIALGTSVCWLRERPWLVFPLMMAIMAGVSVLTFRPLAHRLWQINEAMVRSIQPGKSGSRYVREMPNAGFTRLHRVGPLSLVSHVSGRHFVWPRWLRCERKTYQLELEGETLIMRTTQT